MKGIWAVSLGLCVGVAAGMHGEELPQRAVVASSNTTNQSSQAIINPSTANALGRPIVVAATPSVRQAPAAALGNPVAVLGRPTPIQASGTLTASQPVVDQHVLPAAYSPIAKTPRQLTVRAQDEILPLPQGLPGPTSINAKPVTEPQKNPIVIDKGAPSTQTPIFSSEPPEIISDGGPIVGHPMTGNPMMGNAMMGPVMDDGGMCEDGCGMECNDCCGMDNGMACGDNCFAGCGNNCCGDGAPGAIFWLRAEYLAWWLSDSHAPPLVSTGSFLNRGIIGRPDTEVLFGGNINQAVQHGGRFTAGLWLDPCQCFGLEGSFFYLGQRSTGFARSGGILGRPFFDVLAGEENAEPVSQEPFITGGVAVNLKTRLWGAEANGLFNICNHCCCRLDFLAGFRYLNLKESLVIVENPSDGETSTFITDSFATQNQFYGGQVGVRGKKWFGPWDLELQGKVALGYTRQTVDITGLTVVTAGGVTTTANGGLLTGSGNLGSHGRDRFSVVPEANLNLGYNFAQNWRVFVGYNVLYWSNVVRPGDQIDRGVNPTRSPALVTGAVPPIVGVGPERPAFAFNDTDLWIHGVNAGLEFHW